MLPVAVARERAAFPLVTVIVTANVSAASASPSVQIVTVGPRFAVELEAEIFQVPEPETKSMPAVHFEPPTAVPLLVVQVPEIAVDPAVSLVMLKTQAPPSGQLELSTIETIGVPPPPPL